MKHFVFTILSLIMIVAFGPNAYSQQSSIEAKKENVFFLKSNHFAKIESSDAIGMKDNISKQINNPDIEVVYVPIKKCFALKSKSNDVRALKSASQIVVDKYKGTEIIALNQEKLDFYLNYKRSN